MSFTDRQNQHFRKSRMDPIDIQHCFANYRWYLCGSLNEGKSLKCQHDLVHRCAPIQLQQQLCKTTVDWMHRVTFHITTHALLSYFRRKRAVPFRSKVLQRAG